MDDEFKRKWFENFVLNVGSVVKFLIKAAGFICAVIFAIFVPTYLFGPNIGLIITIAQFALVIIAMKSYDETKYPWKYSDD